MTKPVNGEPVEVTYIKIFLRIIFVSKQWTQVPTTSGAKRLYCMVGALDAGKLTIISLHVHCTASVIVRTFQKKIEKRIRKKN